jgi:Amt family ammonium transporter
MLGKRLGFGQEPMPPHNLTYTFIGATMLWVGWFGFNAGSALEANGQAVYAFVSTHLAAAAGTLAWAGLEWLKRGKPSILGACSGAVAGLVCVTPAAGFVTPESGMILGVIAGAVCYFACTTIKSKFGYDDSLDAFGVHGVGGFVGAILTGVFANSTVSGNDDYKGMLQDNGSLHQVINQLVGAGAALALTLVGSLILLKLIDAVVCESARTKKSRDSTLASTAKRATSSIKRARNWAGSAGDAAQFVRTWTGPCGSPLVAFS